MSSVRIPKALRLQIGAEGRYRCGYCLAQEAVTGIPMEIDHLLPVSRGGRTTAENLWLACGPCNEHKGNRITAEDPESGQNVRLFNPRRDVWDEHFAWADGGLVLVGASAIGRATVSALHLNRPMLVSARQGWVGVGWHPPD